MPPPFDDPLAPYDDTTSNAKITVIKPGLTQGHSMFMVGACTLVEEEYNREGELLMVLPEWPSVTVLDGHYSTMTGLRQTVSDIVACGEENPGQFFSCGYDSMIKLWQVQNGQAYLLDTWRGHRDRVHSMARHASDLILASASQDGSVLMWPYQKDSRTSMRPSPLFRVNARQGIPDLVQWGESKKTENLLFSLVSYSPIHGKGQVGIWDGILMQRLATFQPAMGGLSTMATAPDGSLLALGGGTTMVDDEIRGDGMLRCYDFHNMSLSESRTASQRSCMFKIETGHMDTDSIIFSQDSRLIFSCQGHSQGAEIKVYDLRMNKRQLHVLLHEPSIPKSKCSTTSCTPRILSLCSSSPSPFSQSPSLSTAPSYPPTETLSSVVAWSWLPDDTLVTGGADSLLRFWNLSIADPEQKERQLHADAPISAISIGPNSDGTILLAGTESGSLHIWSASSATVSRIQREMGAPGEGRVFAN